MLRAIVPSKLSIVSASSLSCLCVALAFTPLDAQLLVDIVAVLIAVVVAVAIADLQLTLSAWRTNPLIMRRDLPHAFAIGVPATVRVALENRSGRRIVGMFQEYADPTLTMRDLPRPFRLGARQQEIMDIKITPTARGTKRFDAAGIRLRSRLGLLDLVLRLGAAETRRVFPNFRPHAAFAWLAGDLRVPSLGLKLTRRRGTGTEFEQLVEYLPGDPIRHIDWKATDKHQRPIVRKFREERDQVVMILLDCGRRMRADDHQHGVGTTHFDQCLDAVMLLAFIALSRGDAVGLMTFGTAPGSKKQFAPRKGRQALNALMAELADVQPEAVYSDYPRAAADCLLAQRKHGLIVMLTNSRNEDAPSLSSALKLLQTRHVVMMANLRESVVEQLAMQALSEPQHALECAAALDYMQARDRLMLRIAASRIMTVDCTPDRLAGELVSRYETLKRTAAL